MTKLTRRQFLITAAAAAVGAFTAGIVTPALRAGASEAARPVPEVDIQAVPLGQRSPVNGAALQPRDVVLFRRGRVWRGQLTVSSSGTAAAPITFGAYGSGNLPIKITVDEPWSSGWE